MQPGANDVCWRAWLIRRGLAIKLSQSDGRVDYGSQRVCIVEKRALRHQAAALVHGG